MHRDSYRQSLETFGSATGSLIAGRDWSDTSLGGIEGWSSSLKTALGFLLRSPVPIVMLWGEDGIMLYNDAYSGFAGGRHPELLGSKVRDERRGPPVLIISGYAENEGISPDLPRLTKPFRQPELAAVLANLASFRS